MNRILALILAFALIWAHSAQAQQKDSIQLKHWTVDGTLREALVCLPTTNNNKPRPVIFLFHGHGGNMHEILANHHFQQLWPEAIIVVPQGLKTPGQLVDREGNYSGWQQGPGDRNDRDIHFIDTLVHALEKEYRVDTKRIYATGHSNGGSFTYLVWAMRGNVFAAVAPSAGVAFRYFDLLKPKPVMHIMGETDPLVKPEWQRMMCNNLLKLNNCSNTGQPFAQYTTLYPSKSATPVALYIHPGEHIYPTQADTAVIRFFQSTVQ